MNEPERVKDLYEIISTLNVHRHESFGTIVFSDTILVYPKIEWNINKNTRAAYVQAAAKFCNRSCNHTFRGTSMTVFLSNGGSVEAA